MTEHRLTPTTVGAFLAASRVAELKIDDEWWQVAVNGSMRMWRVDTSIGGPPRWSWWMLHAYDTDDIADLPCRLVPLADADADPSTRDGGDRG